MRMVGRLLRGGCSKTEKHRLSALGMHLQLGSAICKGRTRRVIAIAGGNEHGD